MDNYEVSLVRLQHLALYITNELRFIDKDYHDYSLNRDLSRLKDVAQDIVTDTNSTLLENTFTRSPNLDNNN